MALMNTLRNKMGKFVVGAVAVAILSFVLTDLLGPNSKILGGQDTSVGEIAGNTIDRDEYNAVIEELRTNYILSTGGRTPNEMDMVSIREQSWEKLFSDMVFGSEFDELGIRVTQEELVDMVQGDNIQPEILQAELFRNPETQQFDKSRVKAYLNQLSQLDPQQRASWTNFEANLLSGRRRIKYERMILSTDYVTQAEAMREYHDQTDVAEVKYLYVPFYSLTDSAISTPSDAELAAYLKDNASDYDVEEARTFKYVSFPIVPSAEDSAFFLEDMNKLQAEFQSIGEDSLFARNNSDNPRNAYVTYTIANLPASVAALEEIEEGAVVGPFQGAQYLTLYKVSDIYEDTVYSARASHILFKWEDETPEAKSRARQEAQGILNQIKGGADFAEMARQHGTDGTAVRGGDLGWFTEGRMVEEFENAVMNASRTGLIGNLVETRFGYHIIDVTNIKTNVNYKIAAIEREITPGDQTINDVYRKSEYFAADARDEESFVSAALADSVNVFTANDIDKNARNASTLIDARQIVQWLYNEASIDKVSDVFELDDQYVVAVMTGIREEGTNNLENVKNEVEVKVKNQAKAKAIKDKLSGLSGTLEEMASSYGTDATVQSMSDLKINSNSLNGVGVAPEAVGVAFALSSGEKSEPIILENGVLVMEMINYTKAPEVADYSVYKTQVEQRLGGRTPFNISEALREKANIVDERYRFY